MTNHEAQDTYLPHTTRTPVDYISQLLQDSPSSEAYGPLPTIKHDEFRDLP